MSAASTNQGPANSVPQDALPAPGGAPLSSPRSGGGTHFYEQALDVLSVALGLPREETEALVREYIAERRWTVGGRGRAGRCY
jgi:hypothetical protein